VLADDMGGRTEELEKGLDAQQQQGPGPPRSPDIRIGERNALDARTGADHQDPRPETKGQPLAFRLTARNPTSSTAAGRCWRLCHARRALLAEGTPIRARRIADPHQTTPSSPHLRCKRHTLWVGRTSVRSGCGSLVG
jgi:hypothetical protein